MVIIYLIDDVANYFLSKEAMTPKKLQKLLYYAYSWVLVLENELEDNFSNKLFNNEFEAWVHGPATPYIFEKYKSYGYQKIPQFKDNLISFNESIEDILSQVWDVYGDYTANELESITHQESPWCKARGDKSILERCTTIIKDEDIFECYGSRIKANN